MKCFYLAAAAQKQHGRHFKVRGQRFKDSSFHFDFVIVLSLSNFQSYSFIAQCALQCILSKIDLRHFHGSFEIDPRRIICGKVHLAKIGWHKEAPFLSLDLIRDDKRVDPTSFVVTA